MYRRLYPYLVRLSVFLALAGALTAQTPAPQPAPAKKVLMWKVTSPTSTMYMLGSIHVGNKDLYPLPQSVESAFAESKLLIVEINAKNIDQSKSLELVQKYGIYPEDDALSKHISKETSAALDEFCSKHSIPRPLFEKIKPWVAAITVLAANLQTSGIDTKLGVDLHFLEEVKTPQKIEELETAEFQFSLLASATEQEQQEMLASTLKRIDQSVEVIKKMQAAYLSADAESLLKLLKEEQTGPESLLKKLVDDRNVTMTKSLEGYLQGKEPAFVVVGALHLIGDKGIARLLKDKGYKVEQIVAELK